MIVKIYQECSKKSISYRLTFKHKKIKKQIIISIRNKEKGKIKKEKIRLIASLLNPINFIKIYNSIYSDKIIVKDL